MKREGAENRMRPEYYERDYRGFCRKNEGVCISQRCHAPRRRGTQETQSQRQPLTALTAGDYWVVRLRGR